MNLPLFVYMDKLGIPKVFDSNDPDVTDVNLKLIGIIDPKTYIQSILDKNPKLVSELYKKFPKTCYS